MAAEYSRELSVKVFAGQCRLIELGFRQGGMAGYGLRRQLMDKDGTPKARLATREYKSLQNERVILVPGPEDEIAVVADIYHSFITLRKGETEIAADLNSRGLTHNGKAWSIWKVHEVLINPKYIGTNLYNRNSFKLKARHIRNPPEMWIQRERAFQPIVSTEEFTIAQELLHARNRIWTNDEMLDGLRTLLHTLGRLSSRLIDKAASIPRCQTYARRFGGLTRAYALVGWHPERDWSFVEANRIAGDQCSILIESIVTVIRSQGGTIDTSARKGLLTINKEFTVSIRVARCHQRRTGHQWRIGNDHSKHSDVSLIARMRAGNESILDYYVFPSNEILNARLRLRSANALALDAYRFDNLEFFLGLCRRQSIEGTT
jgi:hypothetical protein